MVDVDAPALVRSRIISCISAFESHRMDKSGLTVSGVGAGELDASLALPLHVAADDIPGCVSAPLAALRRRHPARATIAC